MTAQISNPIKVRAGDDLSIAFTYRVAGVAVDLSGSTIRAHWRASIRESDFIPFTVDSSGAANGRIVLKMTGAQTRAMGRGGVFDVEAASSSGTTTLWEGTTDWVLDVTR